MKKILFYLLTLVLLNYSYAQPPTITSFSPTSGSVGSLVTITGTNLSNPTAITIGGVSALPISNTGTSLVAMVMPGTISGTININTAGGISTSNSVFSVTLSRSPLAQQGNKLSDNSSSAIANQGVAVSISADGNTAIVGGPYDNILGGSWIYSRNGAVWSQQSKLVGAGGTSGAQQGCSVAISGDGNTAVIGGYLDNNNQGAIWVFVRNGNTWSQQGAKLIGSDAIGVPYLGKSVSISADGNSIISGGYLDNFGKGAAWVFTRNGTSWSQQGSKLIGTGNVGSANQGYSVAISNDGNTAIIGGSSDNGGRGAAWIFTRNGNIWSQQGTKLIGSSVYYALQGSSVAINADGNIAVIGGVNEDNTGAAWVFSRTGGTWSQQGGKLVGTGSIGSSKQGYSVGINANGSSVIIGGYNDDNGKGAAWIFNRNGNVWVQRGGKIMGTGSIGNAGHGSSVCISADGRTAMIGARYDNNSKGAAWAYIESPDLSALTISSGILFPAFSADTSSYIDSVPNTVNTITVTPTAIEQNAVLHVRINAGTYNSVISGNPSLALPLNIGSNNIEIKVTSADGVTEKIYSIMVIRLPSPPIITSFSPSIGTVGTLINITGTNLSNLTGFKIGGVNPIVLSNNGSNLVAMVMPNAVTGPVTISTIAGTFLTSSNFTLLSPQAPNTQQGNKLVGIGSSMGARQAAVAISADGSTALVGGGGENFNQGAVWAYIRNGSTWVQQAKITPSNANGNSAFGGSVSLSGDGNTAIIGGPADSSGYGAAWIFTRTAGTWNQVIKLFGTNNNWWSEQGVVSISADGNTVAVGGSQDDGGTGAVWIFVKNNGTWVQQGPKLLGYNTRGFESNQGCSVDLSADGNTLIFGAHKDDYPDIGAAWIFVRTNGVWVSQAKLAKTFGPGVPRHDLHDGISVAISADGNTVLIGSFAIGASVYVRNGSTWTQQGGQLLGTDYAGYSSQGMSVDLSADGNMAIVGGPEDNNGQGATWLFKRDNGIWTQQGSKLVGTGTVDPSIFGCRQGVVRISANGNIAIVGGSGDSLNRGAAWIFTNSYSLPTTLSTFKAFPKNSGIQVEWNAQNETNFDRYEVEKSTNGFNFNKAVTIVAKGLANYDWFDISPSKGDNYYRLKMIDKDNSYKYSSIVNIKIGSIKNIFTVVGNPIKNKIVELQMRNVEKGNYTISVYNNIGQQIMTKIIVHGGGSSTQSIYLDKVSKGTYQLNITGNNLRFTKTLLVE